MCKTPWSLSEDTCAKFFFHYSSLEGLKIFPVFLQPIDFFFIQFLSVLMLGVGSGNSFACFFLIVNRCTNTCSGSGSSQCQGPTNGASYCGTCCFIRSLKLTLNGDLTWLLTPEFNSDSNGQLCLSSKWHADLPHTEFIAELPEKECCSPILEFLAFHNQDHHRCLLGAPSLQWLLQSWTQHFSLGFCIMPLSVGKDPIIYVAFCMDGLFVVI